MADYLDPGDPQDFASWLAQFEEAFADLERAATDQMKPLGARKLGRVLARQIIDESAYAIEQLIAAARRSTGHGDPSGNGGVGEVQKPH